MNLLEKLAKQVADGVLKPKQTLQDWLDTLEESDFEELERLITLQDEDPENEECEIIGQLVTAIYAVETDSISLDKDGDLDLPDIEDEEFFKLVNSFLFLLPFYYWYKQELITINTKISLLANQKNAITITLMEYGK